MASSLNPDAPVVQVVTIQRTDKRFKAAKLAAAILVLLSVPLLAFGDDPAIAGSVVLAAGVLLYLRASFGAWWYHG